MDKIFQIGTFCFRVISEKEIPVPENFLLFEISEDAVPEYTYQIRVAGILPQTEGKILAGRPDLVVYQTPEGEGRLIGRKGQNTYYACCREISREETEVLVAAQEIGNLQYDPVFTSLFALERRMIQKHSLILHCAYIVYQGKAILFSAPSETGKSTQAALWEKYRESYTVNGDRALLRKIDGRWNACGWPVCGSSEICHPGDMPIYAIVMLRQGKVNVTERLSAVQAFTQLYTQITINQWNREFVQSAMEDIEDLIGNVPVWQLTCDISENAVRCLEEALFSGK